MNYNRYWDLHLCCSTIQAKWKRDRKKKFFTHRGTEYRYDFLDDMKTQAAYRESKQEGYESGAWARLFSRENARVLDSSELTHSQKTFLQPTQQGGISEELSRLRYVSCLVSIERLKDGQVYPQLQSLVRWIADNRTINKLRINCHGGGDSLKGFCMGEDLSPAELVQALVRHGLSVAPAKTAQDLTGLAHAARWKRDTEVNECEKCKKPFKVFLRRHHCRRCGGIFCEPCSSWKVDLQIALAGESNKTVPNVKNARVCQQCYEDTMGAMAAGSGGRAAERPLQGKETIYGLKQITLALCMGAKSEDGFSDELGRNAPGANAPFIAGSLAARLLAALRSQQLLGIKVAASNQLVAGGTGQIENSLSVGYPMADGLNGLYLGAKSLTDGAFDFPAVIWGESQILKRSYDAKKAMAKTNEKANLKNNTKLTVEWPPASDITAVNGSIAIEFGSWKDATAQAELDKFYRYWDFSGWIKTTEQKQSQTSRNSPITRSYYKLTPPRRVIGIAIRQGRVFLTGRTGFEKFKDFKSYGVS
jgi:hypothetical protein